MTKTTELTGRPVISSTGLFTPEETITNEELVESFNAYVERFNAQNAQAIDAGEMDPLQPSSVEFIEKASGIRARHVMAKDPILDPEVMAPRWLERSWLVPLRTHHAHYPSHIRHTQGQRHFHPWLPWPERRSFASSPVS